VQKRLNQLDTYIYVLIYVNKSGQVAGQISFSRRKRELSTEIVDNSGEKCAEVTEVDLK
jgi:hypothetical protein